MLGFFPTLCAALLCFAPFVPAIAKSAETHGAKSEFTLPPSAPSKNQPYALNVVYFVPADMEPFPEYKRRISEIMLSLQQFYGEEMEKNGYPGRTFGLNKSEDGKSVEIVTIKGEKNKDEYPYIGSANKILSEINAFFEKSKDAEKYSNHTLIIMPSTSGDAMDPGGVPFYGIGKNCFALDYPLFDLKYRGKKDARGQLFTKWYGGMAHELGHGLNLPHNSGTISDEKKRGTALMGSGNYTLGSEPTFLTPASSAILDQSQVFRTNKMPEQLAPHIDKLPEVAVRFGKSGVRVSGVLPPQNRVEHVLVFYDKDECNNVNGDYDAESFVALFDKETRTFSVEILNADIHPGQTDVFQIRLRLIHDDGSCSIIRYDFDSKDKDLIVPENSKLSALEPPGEPVSKRRSRPQGK